MVDAGGGGGTSPLIGEGAALEFDGSTLFDVVGALYLLYMA